jgi:hypothetical protein
MSPFPALFFMMGGAFKIIMVVMMSTYIIVMITFLYQRHESMIRALRRDRRALHSIVDMLREVENSTNSSGGMSTLERAEFRIRLARFDIGPGSD